MAAVATLIKSKVPTSMSIDAKRFIRRDGEEEIAFSLL